MSGVHIDTSALGRILLGERSASVEATLGAFSERMSSRLLAVELRRLAGRCRRTGEAERLIDASALVPIDLSILSATELLLAAAAEHHGLEVLSP